ncbi:MAG: trigger factor [Lachnospiraceae bacterium]|jgi:trigger factor|nr:trigger factor [Lachnospiraceae bacterium]
MKRKLMLLLCAVCVAALAGGCGTGKENNASGKENTEDVSGSEGKKETIQYNSDDYVELGEYKGLEVSLGSYEVTQDDVKREIEAALLSYPVYEDTDKDTVEDGDFVNIDYEGVKDGVAFNGGTAQDSVLEIGSNSFIDGFEDGLIGVKVGEKVDLNLTFPENYQNQELAGQAVVFHVTVNKIVNKSDMTYDKMDDAFVAANMSSQGYNTVDEFKKGVREQLEASNETTKKQETEAAVMLKLKEACKVKGLPEGLLDQKIEEYMGRFNTNLENYGMKLEDYLSTSGMTEEEFNVQAKELVTDSLEGQLIIESIAKKENITIDEKEFEEYKKKVVEDYGYGSEEALLEQHGEEYVRNVFLNEKVMGMLVENAKITYNAEFQGQEGAGEEGNGDAQEGASEQGADDTGKETSEE